MLNISGLNVESLFKAQKSVAAAWDAEKKRKKKVKAWKNYAEDSFELAKFWQKYLSEIQTLNEKQRANAQLFEFTEKLSQVVGLLFEISGYAYARSENFGAAAQSWKFASEISASLIALASNRQLEASEINRYSDQTTARLHRASLYWLQTSRSRDEEQRATEAVEFASDKLLKDILAASESE